FDQLADLLLAQRISPRRHHSGAPDALTSSLDDLQKNLTRILSHHLAIGKIRRLWLESLRAGTVSLSPNTMAHRAQFLEKDRGPFCGQNPRRNRKAPKQNRKRE